jgi:hypothetical protein
LARHRQLRYFLQGGWADSSRNCMADKRTTPEAPEGAPQAAPEEPHRKKRAAPTIDLTATEVRSAQAETPPQPEPPPATEEPAPANAAQAETRPAQSGSPFASGPFGVAALTGGAAGVVAALVVLLGLYVAGLLPLRPATSTTTATQVAADNQTLNALTQRVSEIEETIKKLSAGGAGIGERLATADSALKSLGVAVAALNRRSDDIAANASRARERAEAAQKETADLQASIKANAPAGAAHADVEALDKRIAALESATQSAQADIRKIATKNSGNDTAARLALSAAVLRDAVLVGAPFADELAAVKELGGDDRTLAPLTPFAASGVLTAQALAHDLKALLPAMIKKTDAAAPQAGFIERLEASAGTLMRFRPLKAPAGNDASSVLARLEIDVSKADIAAALDDLGKLDSATRTPAQGWIAKAQARQAALAAAKQYASDTARVLGSKTGAR